MARLSKSKVDQATLRIQSIFDKDYLRSICIQLIAAQISQITASCAQPHSTMALADDVDHAKRPNNHLLYYISSRKGHEPA